MILPNGFSWSLSRKPKSAQTGGEDMEAPDAENQNHFGFDHLGEQGEAMTEQLASITGRIEEVLVLRDEFGSFIRTFDRLMGDHQQARTRIAEQQALLAQQLDISTALRREFTDLEARAAASEVEVLGLRHELQVLRQQGQDNADTINALKLEAAESASRATALGRQLAFESDRGAALHDATAAKDQELANLDRQNAEQRKQLIELKTALTGANAEVGRLQIVVDEIQPELQRGKQRQLELETALHKAQLAVSAGDDIITQEKSERVALVEKYEHEKNELETALVALKLQHDGLNSRHELTLKYLDHARSAHAESFEAAKRLERASQKAKAEQSALERRLQLVEEQLRGVEAQNAMLEKTLADTAAHNDMLTKAIAAKEVQISHLQSKATSFESRFGSLLQNHESEQLQHEAAKRQLLEALEAERAQRALAQGALTIARASREKMSVQIETLKRGRPAANLRDVLPDLGTDSGRSVHVVATNENSDCVKE